MSLRGAWRSAMPYLQGAPWLGLILTVTVIFLVRDIGSVDPAQSGLISVAAGANANLSTLAWFLAALSIAVWPFLFLWQEQLVNSIEQSGFLPLLLASRMSEPAYRVRRLLFALIVCSLLAAVTWFVGVIVLAGLPGVGLLGVATRFALAILFVYLPNLLLASSLALYLSRNAERASALALGVALPFVWLALIGFATARLSNNSIVIWLTALDPSGVVYLSQPEIQAPGGAGGLTPRFFPLLMNRGLCLAAIGYVAYRYRSAPSRFESGARRLPHRRWHLGAMLRASMNASVVALAVFLAISNLHSNFVANLAFFAIRPSMGFLFRTGLPGIEAYLLAALFLLVGKWVWQSRETGFLAFERASALAAGGRLARVVGRALGVVLVFAAALGVAIAMMFGAAYGAIDWLALAQYFLLYLLPGSLLAASVFLGLSLIAPNRVLGYALGASVTVAYQILMQQSWHWLGNWAVFPAPLPTYDSLHGGIVQEPARIWAVTARIASALILACLLLPLLNRESTLSSDYLAPRSRRWCRLGLLIGSLVLPLAITAQCYVHAHQPTYTANADNARRYAAAAAALTGPADFRPEAMNLQADITDAGAMAVTVSYTVRRHGTAAWLPLTWALRPGALESVRVDGQAADYRLAAPGLWLISAPIQSPFRVTLKVRFGGNVGQHPAALQSFYGRWPSLPVIGVLPELFPDSVAGDPDAVARQTKIYEPAGVSRAVFPVAMSVDHPCKLKVAIPGGREVSADSKHCRTVRDSKRPMRDELYLGIDSWKTLPADDSNRSLRLLAPHGALTRGRELMSAAAGATETIDALMEATAGNSMPPPVELLTLVAGDATSLGDSNALSKPGVIFLSLPMVFDSALVGRQRRVRDFGLLAHEYMHQWFGHAVRPQTGKKGALFVNEAPAEFARGYALRRRFGQEVYLDYLAQQRERLSYILATQSGNDEALLYTTDADQVYPRAAFLANFIASQIGWQALGRQVRDFAWAHAYAAPVTSEQLYAAMARGLAPRARLLARRLAEDGLYFVWHEDDDWLEARCLHAACDGNVLIPVTVIGGKTYWRAANAVSRAEFEHSVIRHISLRE